MLAFFGISCGDYCKDCLYFSVTPKYKSCADAVRSLDNGNYFIQIDPDEGGLINVSCSKDGKRGKSFVNKLICVVIYKKQIKKKEYFR